MKNVIPEVWDHPRRDSPAVLELCQVSSSWSAPSQYQLTVCHRVSSLAPHVYHVSGWPWHTGPTLLQSSSYNAMLSHGHAGHNVVLNTQGDVLRSTDQWQLNTTGAPLTLCWHSVPWTAWDDAARRLCSTLQPNSLELWKYFLHQKYFAHFDGYRYHCSICILRWPSPICK